MFGPDTGARSSTARGSQHLDRGAIRFHRGTGLHGPRRFFLSDTPQNFTRLVLLPQPVTTSSISADPADKQGGFDPDRAGRRIGARGLGFRLPILLHARALEAPKRPIGPTGEPGGSDLRIPGMHYLRSSLGSWCVLPEHIGDQWSAGKNAAGLPTI